MTEYDRGAYTPQADAPLAFDARGPRDRRPMPMTLVASGVVLLVILGALFLAYRGGVKGGAQAPRPVGEPLGAIKTAAAPNADPAATQAQDPTAGADLYAAQNVPNVKPTFAPPPEQPAARPAPQLRVETVAAPKVRIEPAETSIAAAPSAPAATAIRAGAADHVAPAASRPIQTAALAAPAPRAAPVAAVKTLTAAKATAPKSVEIAAGGASAKVADAASAPTSAGGSLVQIGAFSSKSLADKGYADVSSLMAGSMGGKRQHVEPIAHGDKTVFRTTIGGFSDHAAAKAFCASLSAKGHTCFVKG